MKQKVYLVTGDPGYRCCLWGIFDSREEAEKCHETVKQEYFHDNVGPLEIYEVELNKTYKRYDIELYTE